MGTQLDDMETVGTDGYVGGETPQLAGDAAVASGVDREASVVDEAHGASDDERVVQSETKSDGGDEVSTESPREMSFLLINSVRTLSRKTLRHIHLSLQYQSRLETQESGKRQIVLTQSTYRKTTRVRERSHSTPSPLHPFLSLQLDHRIQRLRPVSPDPERFTASQPTVLTYRGN